MGGSRTHSCRQNCDAELGRKHTDVVVAADGCDSVIISGD